MILNPSGSLDVSSDPSELPDDGLTRCKNLRINQKGIAKTRDGSAKLNASAINAAIWWIEEQGGTRYTFAGTAIYSNESSIATGLTSAQWAALKYNAFNDSTEQIYALNGTDRKRIQSGTVYEWGIAAPADAPTLSVGQGTGLTGQYNARYTYIRKVGGVMVAESNPSPVGSLYLDLADQSLAVSVTAPADAQVTHIRLYRTESNGIIYYRDQDIPVATYAYGVCFTWEGTDAYLSGTAYKFTTSDATHSTENTYTWEETPGVETSDGSGYSGGEWWEEYPEYYQQYLEYLQSQGYGYPGT